MHVVASYVAMRRRHALNECGHGRVRYIDAFEGEVQDQVPLFTYELSKVNCNY